MSEFVGLPKNTRCQIEQGGGLFTVTEDFSREGFFAYPDLPVSIRSQQDSNESLWE